MATGAVAASAVGVAVAGVALAAQRTEQVVPKLPAPGATIEVDLASKGLELVFVGQKVKTGPLRGKATFEIESNKGDPSSVQTKISEFYLTSPAKQGGITIAIEPAGRNSKDRSVLRHNRSESPKLQHTLKVPLNITVRYPEILGLPADTEEALTLKAEDAAVLIGRLNGFPAKGARYKLKETTELSLPGQPGNEVATILKFPIRLEGF
ncbi:hypothetical protein O1R50_19845 [Glycomyces luteolus]|uniref:Uncharacterized protein n=1 Tax=Glycomyces luteolus TaxID=2670330 RepID=A0A9X3PD16_9ACTN|nr:hypothetical protein [Glycomyces luteolus]MDA1361891.1 hypothetical protein [Glycomyces luteolus]